MKIFRKAMLSFILVFCATLGLFSGCSDPLANLKISLSGDSLVSQDDVYHLTLTKDDNNPELGSATVTAEVEGIQGDLLSAVEWSYDKNFLSIEYKNSDKTEVVITAINPTKVGTVVNVYSVETKNVSCQIVVDILVKPLKATAKADLSQFGIPIGQDYKLNPADLFEFEPVNSTVPEYTFELNGRKLATDEIFKLATKPANGTINIKAYPTNQDDYTAEVFEALTVTLENVRAYYAINEQSTKISEYGSTSELTNLELVKNTNNNTITLNVSTLNDENIEISILDTNKIVDNYVWVQVNNEAKTIIFTGLRELNDWTAISFKIKVAGVKDALEVQKTIMVRVVDVPDKIVLNGDKEDSDYELRVFDKYKATNTENMQGTKLTLNLSPYSGIYNKIKLTVNTSAESNQTLTNSLLINGVKFSGEYETVAGGTIYLKNAGGYGTLILNVIASDTETMENQDVISRKLVLHMEQGVTGISVGSEYLDSTSQALVLQLDTLNYQTTYQTKKIKFSVLPEKASADTVTVRSLDTSIATVRQDTTNKNEVYVNAVAPGITQIVFEAESGVTHEIDVRVLTVLNGATLNIDSRTDSARLGNVTTKNVIIGTSSLKTLDSAFIAYNSMINLNHNIYPASAESVISDITITSDVDNIATAYPENKTNILLSTNTRGQVNFTMNINYYTLRDDGESGGVNIVTMSKELQFSINVFVPIERIEVNQTNIELLAPTSGISFYDLKNNSTDLVVTVYPSNTEVQASSAKWEKTPASTTKLTLSKDSGSSTTITAQALDSLEDRINVTIVVTIKDINNLIYTKEIAVSITKVKRISNIYIDNYGDQDVGGLYFDYYKRDETFDLNLTISPSNATNKNVEFIIFDAVKLNQKKTGSNVVTLTSGNTYSYYEVKTRNDTDNPTSRVCKTAMIDYDSSKEVYSVKQLSPGYAFLYIIPQDILENNVDSITDLTPQLQNVSDTSAIRRILITIADGSENTPYELRTAEDIANIGKTEYGLKSHYRLMNTIDMSNYLAKNPTWAPIGTLSKPFSGSIITAGCEEGKGVAQSIIGWSISQNYNHEKPDRDSDSFYGIFGVVTGEIKYVNFSINKYQITQTTCKTDPVSGDEYDFGALVGRLKAEYDKNGAVLKTGTISNVTVTVSNFVYSLNIKNQNEKKDTMNVNLGAIGLIDANCLVANVSVNINAQISSDALKINFGAIAGRNKGTIGSSADTTYTNYATSKVVVKNTVADKPDSLLAGSNIGIAVGKNCSYKIGDTDTYGQVYGVICDGSITTSATDVNVGGVVAYNMGIIDNCASSAKLEANGNIGGIAGYNEYNISNAIYEIYSTTNSNCGINASGNIGGIVGQSYGGNITWAMVLGYDKNSPNIIAKTGSKLGGLIGLNKGSTQIEFSVVNASLQTSTSSEASGILGGLIGQNIGTLTINNSYARGVLQNDNLTQDTDAIKDKIGAIIGKVDSGKVNLNAVYAEISEDFAVSGSGTVITSSFKTIILVNDENSFTDTTNLIYLNKTSENAKSLNYFKENYGFAQASSDTAGWAWAENKNDNYIYLQKADGTDFIQVIPNSITVTAKEFPKTTDNSINNILNVTDSAGTIDSKKLIIMYEKDKVYDLSDLFSFACDPNMENVRINVTCSSNNVVQLTSGQTFDKCSIKIVGTGTVVINFVSLQNTSANDTIQIAVINGFNKFNLYEGTDATEGKEITSSDELKIKNGGTNQAFVEYKFGDSTQSSVDGGLRFSVDDNSVFSMSIDGWKGENNAYYYDLSGQDKITLQALKYIDTATNVKVTPYITATFYTLDNGQITGTEQYVFHIDDISLSFDISIYKGASGIAMGIANDTSIYAGDSLTSAVTLFTDNYTTGDDLGKHISYAVYRVSDGNETDITDKIKDIMTISYGDVEYNDNSLVIPFSITLKDKSLSEKTDYKIKFFALDLDGKRIENIVTSLNWSFIPQKINHIDINHYSDAVNTGAKLQQAGELPTNTIIAGQFGLMKINVSPDYAYYDSIEITSGETNGETMTFDQRVLSMEGGVANYYSWQKGVEIIENGIRLYRVSNKDGTFDGIYYVRTLVSELQPENAMFTAYVTIYQGDNIYTNQCTMTVHAPDNLSISYANYNSNVGYAYVAKGTGYVDEKTPTQNQNELVVSAGPTYTKISLTASVINKNQNSNTEKTAEIVSANGKYYLKTGGAEIGDYITVTLTGQQNLSGLINKVTREIKFLVVDFYINSITEGLVNGSNLDTNFRFAYAKDKKYDLRIFEGVNSSNLDTITAITFDHSDNELKDAIMDIIERLNGIGNNDYLGWRAYTTQDDGTIVLTQITESTSDNKVWINDNYCFYNDNEGNLGYQIEANGVSDNSRIKYDLVFRFDNGKFTLVPYGEKDNTNDCRGYSTDDITLDFYQITSQEHAQPIYSEKDLLAMESGIDYILMNDIEISSVWTPITTEISSLNGNGYTISFKPADITSSTGNFGLFDTITENMVVKNVKLKLLNNINITTNVSELSTLRVGLIAGKNEGTVHNCEITRQGENCNLIVVGPQDTTADFAVAGLIGENTSTGAISNSRVSDINITAFGKVAGLVAINSGNISACYYTGGTITNIATISDNNVSTAGLVVENLSNGTIYGSYTGGAYTKEKDGKTTILTKGIIESGVYASGFVYSNMGKISDCYSAMQIIALESSGFVYTNSSSGVINRCYSVCVMSNEDDGVTSVSMPFIGIAGSTATTNNNSNQNGITNCYFYDTGFSANALKLEEAISLSQDAFLGENGTSVFDKFSFSRTDETGGEFTGVWVFLDDGNQYFTPNRFTTNFGPKLVSADLIATPRLNLKSTEVDAETGIIKYSYSKEFNSYFELRENEAFGTDYTYDPITITTATQFNNAFDINQDSVTAINGVIVDDIRLARNLDQSEIETNGSLNSPTQNYAGIFEGNGFTYNNLNLAHNDTEIDRYGLFGTISKVLGSGSGINHIGTVKNFNIAVLSVSCSKVSYVGALAGVVDSGNLYNITVSGTQARVIGNNAVGGVVGYVKGTTRANEISASIGVTANYKNDTDKLYNADLLKETTNTSANPITILGYAGGVFGIADLTQFDTIRTTTNTNEAMLNNIYANGQVSIVGKIVGGVAGLLGVNTVLNNATKIIDSQTLIKGYVFVGGLVGQNNGVIRYGSVQYTDEIQAVEDVANTGEDRVTDLSGKQITINSTAFEGGVDTIGTGGIVGLNIGSSATSWAGGVIYYSSSKVRVRNSNCANVGGVVGVAYGGDIRAVFATGSILGAKVANIGGIVGYIGDIDNDSDILRQKSIITNPFGENANTTITTLDYCVALNNYLVADYNYYLNIKNRTDAYQGGLVGYCYDAGQLATTHINDKNPINYYVDRISNKVVLNSVTTSNDNDTDIKLNAVGHFDIGSVELATAKTRGYMLSNFDTIFNGWDIYSIDNSSGMPQIKRQEIPDIIQIRTVADYMQMYWHPDKTFVLMADLDFDGSKVAVPIGSESAPFTGEFIGNKKTISNITITNTSATNVGMFGATDGATITELNIVNLSITTNLSEKVTAYVGGLIGTARDTTVSLVNISSNITTNANYVGGMFGRIQSTNDKESNISDCYAEINLNLTDNSYDTSTNAYIGGFAGFTQGNVVLSNIYIEGNLALAWSSKKGSQITHYVGGLIGNATKTEINTAISDVNIDIKDISYSLYAGGMFGSSTETNANKVDSASSLNLSLKDLSAEDTFNVGGLIGKSSDDSITSVIVSGDIILNGTYNVSDSTNHAVGGVVGVGTGNTQSIAGGYSIASIKNNTSFENIDLAIYSGNIIKLDCDTYLGLTAKDQLNVGKESNYILNSFNANSANDNFTRSAVDNYARLVTNFDTFNSSNAKYTDLYTSGTGERKTKPIIIASEDDFEEKIDTNNYKYYIQTSNIDINSNREILGWYNGAGKIISIQINTLDYSEFTPSGNYGIFDSTLEKDGQGSVISGVLLRMEFSSKLAKNSKFAGIVSELSENSILFGCYATINAEIGLENGTAYVGGLVGINKGQIIGCASDVNISLYGGVDSEGNATANAGKIIAGGLVGWSQNVDTRLTFIDCYAVGTIKNYNSNASTIIGGMVGKVSNSGGTSLGFYNKNCYTSVNIFDENNTATINPIVADCDGKTNNDNIYYEQNSTTTNPNNWSNFTLAKLRTDTNLNLGSAFEKNQKVNYGLPYLKILSSENALNKLENTGDGTVNSPYQINSAGQLKWALTSGNSGYFELTNDIDLVYIKFTATNFGGNLNGNGHEIKNISQTLITEISGSVSKVKLTPTNNFTGVVLAETITGNASEILINSTSGKVNTSGKIENSMSFGATFNGETQNCFTTYPTYFEGLDGNIWCNTGRKDNGNPVYELLAFVSEVGENTKFGVSVTNDEDAYLIKNIDQLDRIIAYSNATQTSITIKLQDNTISLENKMLKMINNDDLILQGTTVTNGLIYRDGSNSNFTSKSGNNSINTIENCGISLNDEASVFGAGIIEVETRTINNCVIIMNGRGGVFGASSNTLKDKPTLNIKNTTVYANASGALILYKIESAISLSVNMENVTINASEGVEFYALSNSITKEVNLTLNNVIMNNVSGIAKSNSGTINLTTSNSTLNGGNNASLFVENSGKININDSSDTIISGQDNVSGIASTNSGEIIITNSNITVKGNLCISGIAGTNSGTIILNSGKIIVQGVSDVAGIVNTNTDTGTIEINNFTISVTATGGEASGIAITNAGTITGKDESGAVATDEVIIEISSTTGTNGLVKENSGTISNLIVSGEVTSSDQTATGITYTNTGSINNIVLKTLNITGVSVATISIENSGNVDTTVAEKVTLNATENAGGLFLSNEIAEDKTISIKLNAVIDIKKPEATGVGALCVTGTVDENCIIVDGGSITLNETTQLFPIIPEPDSEAGETTP